MNERIQQLLSQAITDVDYIHFDQAIDEELAQMYIPDCFAERFAQLIVAECIDLSLGSSHRDDDIGAIIANKIKQHFGVGMSAEDKKTLIKELLGVKNDERKN